MQLIIKKKVKIINYFINSITLNELLINISKWRQKRIPHYVCVSNVHSCIESFWNKTFKKAHNSADLAVADGRPIFWALKLLGSSDAQHLPGYHITEKIVSMANKQFIKIGFYGTTEKNLNIIHKKLKKNIKI